MKLEVEDMRSPKLDQTLKTPKLLSHLPHYFSLYTNTDPETNILDVMLAVLHLKDIRQIVFLHVDLVYCHMRNSYCVRKIFHIYGTFYKEPIGEDRTAKS